MNVDEFVQARVLPELHPVIAMVRELMRETAPEATEEISYGNPCIREGKSLPSSVRKRRILPFPSPTVESLKKGTGCSGVKENWQNM
jgi:uncharacterized protein YdhG (YjbR/CyaY superfamily)